MISYVTKLKQLKCELIRYVLKVLYLSHSIQSLKNEILQLKLKNLTLSNGTLAPEV